MWKIVPWVIVASVLMVLTVTGMPHFRDPVPERIVNRGFFRVGMNLSPVVDYGTNLPFVDVFKSSRRWIEHGPDITYDAQGYPRLSPGESVDTLMVREIQAHYPSGNYVVTHEGTGTVRLSRFDVLASQEEGPRRLDVLVEPGNGGLLLQIESSDPFDRVRDIHVWMPGFAGGEQLFNPEFLDRMRPFPVVRFMEWQRTNSSPQRDWADRARVEDARYSTDKGVPVEILVDLANALPADPWLCIPHGATDEYVRSFARLVRDRLHQSRKVYVEYTNEAWNSMFQQSRDLQERGLRAGLSDDAFLAQIRFYSQRAVEVMEIFEQEFGGTERLVRVAASQAASAWVSEKILEWRGAFHSFDALAIAPYFGGALGKPETAGEVSYWPKERLWGELEQEIDGTVRGWIADQARVARKYELELVAYEGGQHLVGFAGAENDAMLSDLFVSANRDPRMYDLYRRYLRTWEDEGGGLFVAFNDIGPPSKWGSWGAFEYLDQPVSEAPKARALLDAGARVRRPVGVRGGG